MSDDQRKCEGKKVFSDKVYKLVVSESRVGGSDSKEDNGQEGCFGHKVYCGEFWEGWDVGGA